MTELSLFFIRLISVFLVIATVGQVGFGQKNPHLPIDRVYLKNGSILEGSIIQLTEDSLLYLNPYSNLNVRFSLDAIERYEIGLVTEKSFLTRRVKRERRFYFAANLAAITSGEMDARRYYSEQYSELSFVFGYQFHQFFGMGLHSGRYKLGGEEEDFKLFPIGIEFRGYLTDHVFTPFYLIKGGFTSGSIYRSDPEGNARLPKGGYYFNPGFGFQWNFGPAFNISMDIGMLFGHGFYYTNRSWILSEREVNYKRWKGGFSIGFSF